MSLKTAFSAFALAALFATSPAAAQSDSDSDRNSGAIWNGPYAGLALGVSRGQADVSGQALINGYFVAGDPEQLDPILSRDIDETSINGSLLAGLNHQFDNLVLGVEADLSLNSFDEGYSLTEIPYQTVPTDNFSTSTRIKSDWAGSLRARLGYARDSTLLYISGGPALARFDVDFSYSDRAFGGPKFLRAREKAVKLGWTAGLGLEQRIDGDWSLKGEYLYSNFNNIFKETSTLTSLSNGNGDFSHDIDFETHNFRIAIVRHF
jgi:outer membrane immunogenic protein